MLVTAMLLLLLLRLHRCRGMLLLNMQVAGDFSTAWNDVHLRSIANLSTSMQRGSAMAMLLRLQT